MPESNPASIQTVLCATDFSETAELALEHAIRLARRHDARILLAHVVEPIPLGPYPALMAAENELAIREMAVKRVEEIASRVRADGIVIDTRVDTGNPGPGLATIAEDEGADLIVIGTRGLTGFQHIMLGSTADYIVRRSQCPVLTIHPEDQVSEDPPRTVIVPTNLSPETTNSTDAFAALFGEQRPKIVLTFADRTPPYLEPFRHDTLLKMNQRDVVKEEIERRMEGAVLHLQKAGFEVETAVLDGDPVHVVTEFAREREADLIVMTTHGRSAIVNAILGKTAQRIVQHAPCPVLTVRP
jgi:nucleotide-binding universal stress UspA family protein